MKPSLKQKRLIALVAVIVCFVTLALLSSIDFSKTPELSTNAPYTPDTLPEIAFYDPYIDRANDPTYLTKDLIPSYEVDGVIDTLDSAYRTPYVEFFMDYLTALSNGDAAAIDALCSEVYFRTHDKQKSFSKQYLYDVTIRYFDEATIEKADSREDEKYIGRKLVYFEVTYSIFKNDGSFRRDITDDDKITQIFTLLCDKNGNDPRLNSISYWQNDNTATDSPSLLPLILPLVWLGVTVVSLLVILVLKKKPLLAIPLAAFIAFLVSTGATLVWQIFAFILTLALCVLFLFFIKKRKTPSIENED